MLTSAKDFAEFQFFDKKITKTKTLFLFHSKTLITTKHDCQKQEKVELENSI